MSIKTLFLLAVVAISATSCGGIPYRIDVDQGNVIDQQSLSQLQIGMSKEEVQQVLGTSLLSDVFHQDRWDYVQYYKNGRTQSTQEGKVSLFFSNGFLSNIQAEELSEIVTEPVPYGQLK